MFNVISFYKIFKIKNLNKKKKLIQTIFNKYKVRGTIILANEGINGSISFKNINKKALICELKKILNFEKFDISNFSSIKFQPFHKGKIKIKKELVPMGLELTINDRDLKSHLNSQKWNELIKKKDTQIIDIRKPFEYKIGNFKKSVNPNLNNFRDFPKFLNTLNKNKPIAMYCTGGIRCEKTSVYLRNKGFNKIYQLNGGILKYLKKTNLKESLWQGECFVFDNRISVRHDLKIGTYSICSGCRTPISNIEKKTKKYEEGVSCPNCYDLLTLNQKKRFRMRQKQINLAKQKGKPHIFQKEY